MTKRQNKAKAHIVSSYVMIASRIIAYIALGSDTYWLVKVIFLGKFLFTEPNQDKRPKILNEIKKGERSEIASPPVVFFYICTVKRSLVMAIGYLA